VLGTVLRRGAWITITGVAIGLAASAALARTLASLIWGVGTFDAVTFGGVSLILAAVALFASYVPARRAAKTDPAISLRWE
jgi:ABC-type antimicrobial peptide transport system permease subunit